MDMNIFHFPRRGPRPRPHCSALGAPCIDCMTQDPSFEHGTLTAYQYHRCRCCDCRVHNNEYQRNRRAELRLAIDYKREVLVRMSDGGANLEAWRKVAETPAREVAAGYLTHLREAGDDALSMRDYLRTFALTRIP